MKVKLHVCGGPNTQVSNRWSNTFTSPYTPSWHGQRKLADYKSKKEGTDTSKQQQPACGPSVGPGWKRITVKMAKGSLIKQQGNGRNKHSG